VPTPTLRVSESRFEEYRHVESRGLLSGDLDGSARGRRHLANQAGLPVSRAPVSDARTTALIQIERPTKS